MASPQSSSRARTALKAVLGSRVYVVWHDRVLPENCRFSRFAYVYRNVPGTPGRIEMRISVNRVISIVCSRGACVCMCYYANRIIYCSDMCVRATVLVQTLPYETNLHAGTTEPTRLCVCVCIRVSCANVGRCSVYIRFTLLDTSRAGDAYTNTNRNQLQSYDMACVRVCPRPVSGSRRIGNRTR